MAKLSVNHVTNHDTWSNLVVRSKQHSIYSDLKFLTSLGRRFELFSVSKGKEVKALFFVFLNDENKLEIDDYCIHNTILFIDDLNQKPVKRNQENFLIIENILEYTHAKYKSFAMSLCATVSDVRPFLWYNYFSNRMNDKCKIDIKYTATLDISELFLLKDDFSTKLFDNLADQRKSDIRKAIDARCKFQKTNNLDVFVKMYTSMFKHKMIELSENEIKKIRSIITALVFNNLASIFVVSDENNEPMYSCVFSHHQNKGIYLYGAGNKQLMRRYDATYCIWESMKAINKHGVSDVDFEGVNSPNRGSFKLGFGGRLESYYQITI